MITLMSSLREGVLAKNSHRRKGKMRGFADWRDGSKNSKFFRTSFMDGPKWKYDKEVVA